MHTYERTKDNTFRVYFDRGATIKIVDSEIEAAILVSFLNGGGGPSENVLGIAETLERGKNGKW